MTMQWIAGTTLASDGTIQFSNIPQTFTHLQMRVSAVAPSSAPTGAYQSAIGDYDSGGNILTVGWNHRLFGDGSSASSSGQNSGNFLGWGYGVNGGTLIRSSFIIDILDYANTNKNKTFRCLNGYDANGSGYVAMFSMLAASTSAIALLTFNFGGTQAGAGTRADLYGITTSELTGA